MKRKPYKFNWVCKGKWVCPMLHSWIVKQKDGRFLANGLFVTRADFATKQEAEVHLYNVLKYYL